MKLKQNQNHHFTFTIILTTTATLHLFTIIICLLAVAGTILSCLNRKNYLNEKIYFYQEVCDKNRIFYQKKNRRYSMRYLRMKVLAIPWAILKKYRRYSIGNTSVSDINNPTCMCKNLCSSEMCGLETCPEVSKTVGHDGGRS